MKNHVLEVFGVFLKLGFTSFGGPIAHLGYFQKELIEKRQWISDSQYAQLIALCQFLPGPASSQVGFSLGLIRAGWLGALCAFIAFTLPSVFLLLTFVWFIQNLSGSWIEPAVHGLKIVALVVVADALWNMQKKLCSDYLRRGLAIFVAMALLLFPFPGLQILLVIIGAVVGMLWCSTHGQDSIEPITVAYGVKAGWACAGVFAILFAGLLLMSSQSVWFELMHIFYQAGSLVFGGGHVVLPLLESSVVNTGLLTEDQFLVGYGASQALPGPLFSFAGYLGALMPTDKAAWIGALVATGFIFLPGFLLLLAFLPFWQSMTANKKMTGAIAGVNAAVVGLLAAVLIDPILFSAIVSTKDIVTATVGLAILLVWKLSPLWVVLWCVLSQWVLAAVV